MQTTHNPTIPVDSPYGDTRCAPPRYRYRIRRDECSESPMEWKDNVHLWIGKNHYLLGQNYEHESLGELDEDLAAIEEREGRKIAAHIVVYGYEHGGLALQRGRTCRWDSGVLGILFVLEGDYEYPEQVVEGVFEDLKQWVDGDVYGIEAIYDGGDRDGEIEDSVWGIYAKDAEDIAGVLQDHFDFDHAPAAGDIEKVWDKRFDR